MKRFAALTFSGLLLTLGYWGFGRLTDSLCLRGPRFRSLPTQVLLVGDTVRLRAGTYDILMECDLGPPTGVTWHSSNESVFQVDSTGLLTARGIGSAEIIAKAGWDRASHRMQVVRQ